MFYQGQCKVKFFKYMPIHVFFKMAVTLQKCETRSYNNKKIKTLKHKHQYGCSTIKNDIISHLVYSEQQKLSKPTRLDCNKYYLATNIL